MNSLLIVGSKRSGALELAFARAFERLGVAVEHFDSEAPVASLTRNRIVSRLTPRVQFQKVGQTLFDFLKDGSDRFDAVLVFKGMWLTPGWIQKCKTRTSRAIWINFNPDDPFNLVSRGSTNRNVVRSIPLFDIYAIWGEHLLPALRDAGCERALYLPFGFDRDLHFPAEQEDPELTQTLSFVGAWDPERERILTEVADFPLRIWGYGWDRVGSASPLRDKATGSNIYGAQLRSVISSSRASFNLLRPQNFGAHNMRTFEIPAMRGLMVATFSPEQDHFFPRGHASLLFEDIPDLRCQLECVMETSFDAQEMKRVALAACHSQSYDNRARALHEAVTSFRKQEQPT